MFQRLAVCSWSLQPTSADDLFVKLADTGLNRVQIALDPIRENAGGAWTDFSSRAQGMGVTCVSGMFVTAGEDYSTLESIRDTGGVVPDSTWEENWSNIQANADLAQVMGLKFVSFHAGFLPHEESDPGFAKLKDRITQIAGLFADRGITLGFETGQSLTQIGNATLHIVHQVIEIADADPGQRHAVFAQYLHYGTFVP